MSSHSPTEDENGTLFLNPGLASNVHLSLYAHRANSSPPNVLIGGPSEIPLDSR
jgi:hypothetical protein